MTPHMLAVATGEAAADQVATLVIATVGTVLLGIGALFAKLIAGKLRSVQAAVQAPTTAGVAGQTVLDVLDEIRRDQKEVRDRQALVDSRIMNNEGRIGVLDGRFDQVAAKARDAHDRIDELTSLVTALTTTVGELTAAVHDLTRTTRALEATK